MVGLGGMLGCLARYFIGGWVQRYFAGDFPYGTLAVNISGSFILGVVMVLSLERQAMSDSMRLLLTTGFCGGFTTMSAFSFETVALAGGGYPAVALAYMGVTLLSCIGAAWLGMVAGRVA